MGKAGNCSDGKENAVGSGTKEIPSLFRGSGGSRGRKSSTKWKSFPKHVVGPTQDVNAARARDCGQAEMIRCNPQTSPAAAHNEEGAQARSAIDRDEELAAAEQREEWDARKDVFDSSNGVNAAGAPFIKGSDRELKKQAKEEARRLAKQPTQCRRGCDAMVKPGGICRVCFTQRDKVPKNARMGSNAQNMTPNIKNQKDRRANSEEERGRGSDAHTGVSSFEDTGQASKGLSTQASPSAKATWNYKWWHCLGCSTKNEGTNSCISCPQEKPSDEKLLWAWSEHMRIFLHQNGRNEYLAADVWKAGEETIIKQQLEQRGLRLRRLIEDGNCLTNSIHYGVLQSPFLSDLHEKEPWDIRLEGTEKLKTASREFPFLPKNMRDSKIEDLVSYDYENERFKEKKASDAAAQQDKSQPAQQELKEAAQQDKEVPTHSQKCKILGEPFRRGPYRTTGNFLTTTWIIGMAGAMGVTIRIHYVTVDAHGQCIYYYQDHAMEDTKGERIVHAACWLKEHHYYGIDLIERVQENDGSGKERIAPEVARDVGGGQECVGPPECEKNEDAINSQNQAAEVSAKLGVVDQQAGEGQGEGNEQNLYDSHQGYEYEGVEEPVAHEQSECTKEGMGGVVQAPTHVEGEVSDAAGPIQSPPTAARNLASAGVNNTAAADMDAMKDDRSSEKAEGETMVEGLLGTEGVEVDMNYDAAKASLCDINVTSVHSSGEHQSEGVDSQLEDGDEVDGYGRSQESIGAQEPFPNTDCNLPGFFAEHKSVYSDCPHWPPQHTIRSMSSIQQIGSSLEQESALEFEIEQTRNDCLLMRKFLADPRTVEEVDKFNGNQCLQDRQQLLLAYQAELDRVRCALVSELADVEKADENAEAAKDVVFTVAAGGELAERTVTNQCVADCNKGDMCLLASEVQEDNEIAAKGLEETEAKKAGDPDNHETRPDDAIEQEPLEAPREALPTSQQGSRDDMLEDATGGSGIRGANIVEGKEAADEMKTVVNTDRNAVDGDSSDVKVGADAIDNLPLHEQPASGGNPLPSGRPECSTACETFELRKAPQPPSSDESGPSAMFQALKKLSTHVAVHNAVKTVRELGIASTRLTTLVEEADCILTDKSFGYEAEAEKRAAELEQLYAMMSSTCAGGRTTSVALRMAFLLANLPLVCADYRKYQLWFMRLMRELSSVDADQYIEGVLTIDQRRFTDGGFSHKMLGVDDAESGVGADVAGDNCVDVTDKTAGGRPCSPKTSRGADQSEEEQASSSVATTQQYTPPHKAAGEGLSGPMIDAASSQSRPVGRTLETSAADLGGSDGLNEGEASAGSLDNQKAVTNVFSIGTAPKQASNRVRGTYEQKPKVASAPGVRYSMLAGSAGVGVGVPPPTTSHGALDLSRKQMESEVAAIKGEAERDLELRKRVSNGGSIHNWGDNTLVLGPDLVEECVRLSDRGVKSDKTAVAARLKKDPWWNTFNAVLMPVSLGVKRWATVAVFWSNYFKAWVSRPYSRMKLGLGDQNVINEKVERVMQVVLGLVESDIPGSHNSIPQEALHRLVDYKFCAAAAPMPSDAFDWQESGIFALSAMSACLTLDWQQFFRGLRLDCPQFDAETFYKPYVERYREKVVKGKASFSSLPPLGYCCPQLYSRGPIHMNRAQQQWSLHFAASKTHPLSPDRARFRGQAVKQEPWRDCRHYPERRPGSRKCPPYPHSLPPIHSGTPPY